MESLHSDNYTGNRILVFGSNLQGIHGKGAAKDALQWGAIWGIGEGLQGNTYAIPTRTRQYFENSRQNNYTFKTLPLEIINKHVQTFINFAKSRPDLEFILTPIGTGYANIHPKYIAEMFWEPYLDKIPNIVFPEVFLTYLRPFEKYANPINYEQNNRNSQEIGQTEKETSKTGEKGSLSEQPEQ